MAIITDSVSIRGVPLNGATVQAFKASRFGTPPVANTAPPANPDATAVTGLTGDGAFQLTTPTLEDYWVAVPVGGKVGWQLYPLGTDQGGGGGGAVASVFGRTGAVTAQSNDYSVAQVTGAAPTASPTFSGTVTVPVPVNPTDAAQLQSVAVSSVFGRTGAVVSATNDYTAAQVTNAADKSATAAQVFTGEVFAVDPFMRSGAIAETYSRAGRLFSTSLTTLLTSGQLCGFAVNLPSGVTVTNIAFVSTGTAAVSPTHWFFELRDQNLALLRQTADQTTTAWAASTEKILPLSSTFTTTYTGIHYLCIMVAAGTVPSILGVNSAGLPFQNLAPALSFIDNTHTGITTPATSPATATNSAGAIPAWAYCS